MTSRDRVLTAIKKTLTANGIDLPFPTQQILFHDQTEETDGDRSRQREGWPAGNREVPLVQRDFPSPYRYDQNHKLRIIAPGTNFTGLFERAFNQIRQYGKSDVGVTIRLLEAIETIANYTNNRQYCTSLKRHADMILQDSREGLLQELDRQDVERQYHAVIKALDYNKAIKNWNFIEHKSKR